MGERGCHKSMVSWLSLRNRGCWGLWKPISEGDEPYCVAFAFAIATNRPVPSPEPHSAVQGNHREYDDNQIKPMSECGGTAHTGLAQRKYNRQTDSIKLAFHKRLDETSSSQHTGLRTLDNTWILRIICLDLNAGVELDRASRSDLCLRK